MRIARRLVVFLKRPGGQAQFSVPLTLQSSEDSAFENISTWMQDNLRRDLRVESLAERVGIAPAHSRAFFGRRPAGRPAKRWKSFASRPPAGRWKNPLPASRKSPRARDFKVKSTCGALSAAV